eukprot:IDg2036t1
MPALAPPAPAKRRASIPAAPPSAFDEEDSQNDEVIDIDDDEDIEEALFAAFLAVQTAIGERAVDMRVWLEGEGVLKIILVWISALTVIPMLMQHWHKTLAFTFEIRLSVVAFNAAHVAKHSNIGSALIL